MTTPVRIPADVDRADRLIGPLTARQLTILAVTGLVVYAAWTATRTVVVLPVFLILAIPIGATAAILALGQRDGLSLDRMLLAAIRQHRGPRHRVTAPEGVRPAPQWLTAQATTTPGDTPPEAHTGDLAALHLPAAGITEAGVIDLGADGLALVAVASTVNFALRTPTEQERLVASFGHYLHSLTAPIQLVVRTERLDLSTQITHLHQQAGGLPHPALEAAAIEHADYLTHLGEHTDLLRRQVLLVLREDLRPAGSATELTSPSPMAMLRFFAGRHRTTTQRDDVPARRAAQSRLVRRLGEAVELLTPAGIVITPLDAGQTTAVLACACNPDTLLTPSAALAGANDIITSPSEQQSDPYPVGWAGGPDNTATLTPDRDDDDPDNDTPDSDDDNDEFDDRRRD